MRARRAAVYYRRGPRFALLAGCRAIAQAPAAHLATRRRQRLTRRLPRACGLGGRGLHPRSHGWPWTAAFAWPPTSRYARPPPVTPADINKSLCKANRVRNSGLTHQDLMGPVQVTESCLLAEQ